MSTVVELVKRNFELANEVSELKKENARLREALEVIAEYSCNWNDVEIARTALDELDKMKGI